MFTIQKTIDFNPLSLLAACILPLCLAVPALGTAASPANPAARAGDLLLPAISSMIDPPEIPFPKPPPPPPCQGTTPVEQTA